MDLMIINALKNLHEFTLRNALLDPIIILFDKDFKKSVEPIRRAKRNGDLDSLIEQHEKLASIYNNIASGNLTKEAMLSRLTVLGSNSELNELIRSYSSDMGTHFRHVELFELIVYTVLSRIEQNQILTASKAISDNALAKIIAAVTLGSGTRYQVQIAHELSNMAEHCRAIDKDEVLKLLGKDPFVITCFSEASCITQINFFKYLLADKQDEDALRTLRFCRTWLAIKKTPEFYEFLQDLEPRFISAIEYE